MYHYVGVIQMKNYLYIILGLIIATIGLASAFVIQDQASIRALFLYGQWQFLFLAFPNLITGIVVFFGGIAIAVTGELYRRRLETKESLACPNCGKTL